MIWQRSHRADPRALPLANRHYNRQKPDSPQFVPPGACLVLLALDERALWVSSHPKAQYVKHQWAGAWVNTLFRNEGSGKASELILQTLSVTRFFWTQVPPLGMVSFVDERYIIPKKNPGWCYLKAGFSVAGRTQGGLLCLQILPNQMPPPEPPAGHPWPLQFDPTPAQVVRRAEDFSRSEHPF